MSKPKHDWDGLFDFAPFNIKDKAKSGAIYTKYMLSRVLRMFEYEGLPDTITPFNAELMLMCNGFAGGVKVNGELYLMRGGLGGEPDPYYLPTILTVANPALNYSANLKINEDCVIIKNDSMYQGLIPMFSRYATLLAENDITMWLASINTRIQTLISAEDDRTRVSAEEFLKHIIDGDLGVITESKFLDGLRAQSYLSSTQNHITQLIELHQYLKAGWYNDIGLQANYNMKRESINSNEAQLNNDALFPLIDDMEQCRQEGWEQFNTMFGTNVKVKRSGVWKANVEEMQLSLEALENSVEEPEPENTNDGGEVDVDEEETKSDDNKLED